MSPLEFALLCLGTAAAIVVLAELGRGVLRWWG